MTRFKIVSTGWKCWPWIQDTLASIDAQEYNDYDVCVVDDASGDETLSGFITTYCSDRGWKFILNEERKGAVFNQVAAIRHMDPRPEDVIVWVDPDGDKLKHPGVLHRLNQLYSDGSKLIYTQYDTEPYSSTCAPSRSYPRDVIANNSYREFSLAGRIWWNHLRTMKAELFLEMDDSDFQDNEGNWFTSGTDSAFMFPGLELARGKVKFVDEVMLTYHSENPMSDWRRQPDAVDQSHHIILTRPPKC